MILPFALDLTGIFETVYQILAAGVAITAVALVMYASSFNLRDRLVLTYVFLLVCVLLIYAGEAMAVQICPTQKSQSTSTVAK